MTSNLNSIALAFSNALNRQLGSEGALSATSAVLRDQRATLPTTGPAHAPRWHSSDGLVRSDERSRASAKTVQFARNQGTSSIVVKDEEAAERIAAANATHVAEAEAIRCSFSPSVFSEDKRGNIRKRLFASRRKNTTYLSGLLPSLPSKPFSESEDRHR
jgi:hypothetical protein